MARRRMRLILLFTVAFSFAAGAIPIRCDTCRDDASFRAEAEAAGPGTHLVYSLETGVVQQWQIAAADSAESPAPASDTPAPAVPNGGTEPGERTTD